MNKQDLRVYNFSFGTLTQNGNEVKVDIESTQFTHDNVTNIKNDLAKQDDRFLPLEQVKEGNNYISLIYQKSDKLKNGIQLKQEEYPVKASIAQTILEHDILSEYADEDRYISINPSTLYYYPMTTVRYSYTGNEFMPREQYTNLERYKACIVSLLSNISYEKCLTTPEEVKQEGNELITEIYNQKNVPQLLNLIKSSQDYITYNYITRKEGKHKETIKWYQIGLGALALTSIFGILFVQMNANGNQVEQAQAYEEQLNNKDLAIEGNEAFENGEYEEATNTLLEAGEDPQEVASRLIEEGQYQLALNTDETVLEETIQHAYDNDNQQAILDLQADKLSEEASSKLADEQAIIEGDNNTMQNVLNFLDDEHTAERLAVAFAEQGNLNHVQTIAEQYPDNETIQEAVNNTSAETQIQELQQTLDDLNSRKDGLDEDEDSEEIEDIDNQISDIEDEISSLEEQSNGSNEDQSESESSSESSEENNESSEEESSESSSESSEESSN